MQLYLGVKRSRKQVNNSTILTNVWFTWSMKKFSFSLYLNEFLKNLLKSLMLQWFCLYSKILKCEIVNFICQQICKILSTTIINLFIAIVVFTLLLPSFPYLQNSLKYFFLWDEMAIFATNWLSLVVVHLSDY